MSGELFIDSLVLWFLTKSNKKYISIAEIVIGSYHINMMNYKYIPVLHLLDSLRYTISVRFPASGL